MDENYRFIGPLDSAKTAHYSSKAVEKENWWIPDDELTWNLHVTSAAAMALKQILWGEIICIPRNQYLDSPGWITIADYLVNSKSHLFSVSIYDPNLELSPNGFLIDCSNQFKNVTGSSLFAMSGWPGLSPKQRLIIAENILSTQSFKHMFKGLRVDENIKTEFFYQRDVLEKVFRYLKKNYQKNPNLILRSDSPKSTMWQKIVNLIENDHFKEKIRKQHGEEFSKSFIASIHELSKLARENNENTPELELKWLNQRSNLYQNIFDREAKLREYLLRCIDKAYDETLGESVSRARLVFSDRSDSQLPFTIRDKYFDLIDSSNSLDGLAEKSLIIPKEIRAQSKMMTDIIETINHPEVDRQIQSIRRIRIAKGLPIDFIQTEEEIHLEFLSTYFSNVIVKNSGKQKIVDYSFMAGSFGVKVVTSYFVGSLLSDISLNPWVISLAGQLGEGMLDRAGLKLLSIKDAISDNLLKNDKIIQIGRTRDWLSAPPRN